MIMTMNEAIKRYGPIVDGKWANESKWMTIIQVPAEISETWMNSATHKPTTKIYINKDLVNPLLCALDNVRAGGLVHELKTFDGCFIIRTVRGSKTALSTHSYGCALDINAQDNGLGCVPKISRDLVECFTDEGFTWGGTFRRPDGMHFSRCFE